VTRPTLVELESFRAIMASGGATAAAHRLGRAQSSVSRAIAALEARLGVTLFQRRGRTMVATAEAVALNRELDAVFAALDRVTGVSADLGSGAGQRLLVGAPAPFALSLLPAAMAAYRRHHPDVLVELQVAPSDELAALVAEGRLDLAITDTVPQQRTVRLEAFRRSRIACIMPARHPLARKALVTPQDLDGLDFIALTKRHVMRRRIDALFHTAGIGRRLTVEASTALAAIACVEHGLGLTLLNPFPFLTLPPSRPAGLAMRPFSVRLEYRTAFLLPVGRMPPQPVRGLMAALRQAGGRKDEWSEPLKP
jgi:DNA-binding transcriptional LysR family regulator